MKATVSVREDSSSIFAVFVLRTCKTSHGLLDKNKGHPWKVVNGLAHPQEQKYTFAHISLLLFVRYISYLLLSNVMELELDSTRFVLLKIHFKKLNIDMSFYLR